MEQLKILFMKRKKTKFGTEKYSEKKLLDNNYNNIISNNYITTNFIWLEYNNNSCRYDVFCTFYFF